MCGIAGIIDASGRSPDRELLSRMIGVLRHRGPDASGVFVDREAGLAHARLSIIDLEGGQQPMRRRDQSLAITFNGEIFNYVELRRSLQQRGHRFVTSSDTEVIIEAYAQKGPDCVHDFNGQWSFAIWDARRREMFLSRDRLGIRPLYYTVIGGTLIFASEIKSILIHPAVSRSLDLKALQQILTFWHTIGDRTCFQGIHELPPGHCMRFSGGKVVTWPYWSLRFDHSNGPLSVEDYAEGLFEHLVEATRLRLRSDVPVGAYLSGGLDSSVITALVKRFSNASLSTFSVSFSDAEFDESAYQADVIRHLDTDHHQTCCTLADIAGALPDVIWHTEKPILRTAPAPLFQLSRLARDHGYKVVLTGEGADEALGGYDIFKEAKIRRFWAAQHDSKLRPLLLKRLYPYLQDIQALPEAYLRSFFRVRPDDLSSPFYSHLPRWEMTSKLTGLLSPAVKAELRGYDVYEDYLALLPDGYEDWHAFCQAQYIEATGLMPGYILSSQGDRMLMSHSVEGRFPFLDHHVVEYAATIPPRWKMKGLNEKYILKRAVGDLVPASVRERPKQPYRAPDGKSFFADGLDQSPYPYVQDLLSRECIANSGVFRPSAIERLVTKARHGKLTGTKDNMALVGALSTQLVIDQFVNHNTRQTTDATN